MSIREPNNKLSTNALLLAATGFIEYGLQFVLPIVLVRNLQSDDFGVYRLLMLTATTALGIAPLLMPHSLYFFLPRHAAAKSTVIGNVIVYLCLAGFLVALVTSPLNPLIGEPLRKLYWETHGLTSLFFWLWVIVSITMVLPIAEGRVLWFVSAELCSAFFRTLLLSVIAIYSHKVSWLVCVLVVDMLLRLCVLAAYLTTRKDNRKLAFDYRLTLSQLKYSVPFAAGGALFMMRVQSDQWIVAARFSQALFASFTIGAVVLPIASLIRQPINSAVLPHVSVAFARNDVLRVRQLLFKTNLVSALVLLPVAGGLFLLAPELVKLIYTERYITAVPVMRVYLVGIAFQTIATGYALPSLNMGGFAMRTNAFCLAISVICSLIGANYFGHVGAALGSVITFAVAETLNLRAICRELHVTVIDVLPLGLLLRIGFGVVVAACVTNAVAWGSGHGLLASILLKMSVFLGVLGIGFAMTFGWPGLLAARSYFTER
ncbi:MAG: lipopolysaccharide biosynthesis protein [Halobacteriota archaeon]